MNKTISGYNALQKNPLMGFSFLLIILHIIDIVTTKYALSMGVDGIVEVNPIMAYVVDSTMLFILIKLILIGVIIMLFKKCISQDKRIAMIGMKVIVILMLIVVLNNTITIVTAESGTISISDDFVRNGNAPDPTFDANGFPAKFDPVIYFDTNDYSYLSVVRAVLEGYTYPYSYNSSYFTITQGGSGGGYVNFMKQTSNLTFVFNDDATFTGGNIKVALTDNFFQYFGTTGSGTSTWQCTATGVYPVGISANNTTEPKCVDNQYMVVATRATDSYQVDYPIAGYFRVNVSKNQVINTSYQIRDYSGATLYSNETSFNRNHISGAMFPYGAGISLNTTLSSGYYIRTWINSSGCTTDCVDDTPAETYPDTGANVFADKSIYVEGENILVNWYIADDPYNNTLSRCRLLDNEVALYSAIPQTGNYTIVSPDLGVHNIEIACGILYYTVAGSVSVQVVSEGQSVITIAPITLSAVAQNATFKYGYSATTSVANAIAVFYWDGSDWKQENTYYTNTICGGVCSSNTNYNGSVLLQYSGKYRLDLRGHNRGVLASVFTEAVYQNRTAEYPLNTSFITTDSDSYFLQETADVSYGVDSTNFSNYKIYLEMYNYNLSSTSMKIFLTTNKDTQYHYFKSRKDLSGDFLVYVGNNKWSLKAYHANDTLYKEIAYKNITVASVNALGYGLEVSNSAPCVKDFVDIKVTIPSASNLSFLEPSNRRVNLQLLNSRTLHWSTDRTIGVYVISIIDPSGNLQALNSITIKNCVASNVSVSPEQASSDSALTTIDSWTAMFGLGINAISKFLFGLCITVIFMLTGYIATKFQLFGGMIFGLLPYCFFVFIEYFPLWTVVVIILTVALKVGWFK